jgi:AraC-like DNA-binding protein
MLESGQMVSKIGQNANTKLYASLLEFDPDIYTAPIVGQMIEVDDEEQSVPMHQHSRGQLLTTSKGIVRCETVDGSWNVAPVSALWIPARRPHRSIVSSRGTLTFLYFAEGVVRLPATSCFISLSPLVREMVRHLADADPHYAINSAEAKIASALAAMLEDMHVTVPFIPMPLNPKLRRISDELLKDPGDRRTAAQWATSVGMSEKSLRRLISSESGISFLQWRQQFRLMEAIRGLREGASVRDVANQIGYDSIAAFSTMFKKAMGVSPGLFANSPNGNGNPRLRSRS